MLYQDLDSLLIKLGFRDRGPVLVGASLGGLTALCSEAAASFAGAVALVDITPRMELAGVHRIVSFMKRTAEHGFATLDEAADAVAGYQPHRKRPRNLESLQKNLRLGSDNR